MSRIYEALERAENERLQRQENYPLETVQEAAATPVAVVTAPASRPMVAPTIAPIPARSEPAVAAPSLVERPEAKVPAERASEKLDLSSIRREPWAPKLDRLPALEERGRGVEQFRSLRSRLFEFRDLIALKTVLVSSGLPQEGKSFVAANLAISFARHKGGRVLLIDGDMRRSSLHHLLGTTNKPGLSTYLTGEAGLAEVMQRPLRYAENNPLLTGLDSLTFIAGGDEGDKAADLSGSPRFKGLIEQAKEHFDWIVVDSSPVNLVTDGVNLAHACEGVLLVVRGGITKIETVQRALGELKATRMLGVVLNAVPTHEAVDSYYGYDGYDTQKN